MPYWWSQKRSDANTRNARCLLSVWRLPTCRASTLTVQNKTRHCKTLLSPQGGRSKQRNGPGLSSLRNIAVSVVFHLIYCYFLALFCARCLVTFHQTLPQNIPKFEGGKQLCILLKKIDCTTDVWVCVCVWACVSEACAFSHTLTHVSCCVWIMGMHIPDGAAVVLRTVTCTAWQQESQLGKGVSFTPEHSRTILVFSVFFFFFVLAA